MRARPSIPPLACVLWVAVTACGTSPTDVQRSASQLTVAPSVVTLQVGSTLQLTLTARDEEGQAARPSDVAWSTSNPQVASVSWDGVVTGGDLGEAQITASWNGVYGSSSLTVTNDGRGPSCSGSGSGATDLSLEKACVTK